jgi:hypothetical protein
MMLIYGMKCSIPNVRINYAFHEGNYKATIYDQNLICGITSNYYSYAYVVKSVIVLDEED